MSNEEQLKEALQEALKDLIQLTSTNRNFSWGSFLLSSVLKCADEVTLEKMIADIKEYTNSSKAEPHMYQ